MVSLLLSGLVAAQQACDMRQYPLSSPTSRFEDNADGTVTDTVSKLMWARCSLGQQWRAGRCSGSALTFDWAAAQAQVIQANTAGTLFFSDWRLPLIRELATIAERQCKSPRINLSIFPDTPAATYWSSSSRSIAASDNFAFALAFGADGIFYADKQALQHVRLVRNAR